MERIKLNACKTVAVIFVLTVLLIYYRYLFECVVCLHQRLYATASRETAARNDIEAVTTSKRIKRFLTFEGGGVVKLVFGTSFPVVANDKSRSLNYFYNFQVQYSPPFKPLNWWSFLNTTTFAARQHFKKRSVDEPSRSLIYEFMETLFERSGYAGNECILKVICELSRAPFVQNPISNEEDIKGNIEDHLNDDCGREIYQELINAVFRPLPSNMDERYLNAKLAGEKGSNCDKTFGACPIVDKWFQRFTRFI